MENNYFQMEVERGKKKTVFRSQCNSRLHKEKEERKKTR